MRRLVPIAACLSALLAAVPAAAAPAPHPPPAQPAAALPPQGIYEQCGPAVRGLGHCMRRLDRIRRAGFTHVLNYTSWFATRRQVRRYADHAARIGIKLIWPLNDRAWRDGSSLRKRYPVLARSCRCRGNRAFTAFAMRLVRRHRATWGWYVADEPQAVERGAVERLSRRVRRLDRRHPRMVVTNEFAGSDGANTRPFASAADVVGADIYPIGTRDPLESVGPLAGRVQQLADEAGRRSVLVLQAFSWAGYLPDYSHAPWPTQAQMRQMRDLALARARPSLILWYSFQDVLRPDAPRGQFGALARAAFGPVL